MHYYTELVYIVIYSRYIQSVHTVCTYSRYIQSVHTVGTYSRYIQSVSLDRIQYMRLELPDCIL